ncbi:MAG: AMP-binding protein [Clostridia bacterium]|nr:AMP-binding protein [Clostridia bacterium]
MVKNYPLYETTFFADFRIMVENAAKNFPDRYALSYRNKPIDPEPSHITYAQAAADIRALGTALIDLGCRDKHCAIIGGATPGWVYSYFSLMAVGAVTVPLDKEWPENDLADTILRAECEYVFYSSEVSSKLAAIRAKNPQIRRFIRMWGEGDPEDLTLESLQSRGYGFLDAGNTRYDDYRIDPDRLASIVFTSGTTGKGKGVMLSQTNIVSDMTQGMYNFAISPKTMCFLPLHHTFGSTVNLVGHYAQGSEIYLSSGLKYITKELKEQKPTHLILVPLFVETLYKKMIAGIRDSNKEKKFQTAVKLSKSLRKVGIDKRKDLFKDLLGVFGGRCDMIICGGAALNQDIIDFFENIGITVLNGYGITECAPLISCNRNKLQKKGSVGIPIIGEKVKIYQPGEDGEGEICVKGPNVMLGYYKDPEATAAVFDENGYFHTGDWGRLDEDGWLFITGRIKNIIILANGKNVYPEELETEITRIEGVNEVVVYEGEPAHRKEGENIIVAEIFPDRDFLESRGVTDLQAYFEDGIKEINGRNPSYKAIHRVKLRETEFPKNTSRKITKFSIDRRIDG